MFGTIFGRAGNRPPLLRHSRSVGATLALAALAAVVPGRLAGTEFRGVRLSVSDPQSAAEWYCTHLGATLVPLAPDAAPLSEGDARMVRTVQFGKITLDFFPGPPPSAIWPLLGSVGSGVDHLGFGYADLDGAMKRFAKTGVEIVSGIEREGPIRYAFIKDRWGTLIELVEDREIHGFHHVHLATTNPQATLKWYTDLFGGRVTRFAGVLPGIRYGDVWVLVKTAKVAPAPTEGRAIDRLIWATDDARVTLERLSALRMPYTVRSIATRSRRILVAGPDRVQTEILSTDRPLSSIR